MCAKFLWNGKGTSKTLYKVAWESCCFPKEEGGMGLRRLEDICQMEACKQIWKILVGEVNVWTKWMTQVLLKGDNIWAAKRPSNPSWIWSNILSQRRFMREHIRMIVGNGQRTSFWFDTWCNFAPLCRNIEDMPWNTVNICKNAVVGELISRGEWDLDQTLLSFQVKQSILNTTFNLGSSDKPMWANNSSSVFYSKDIIDLIRYRGTQDYWKEMVWFHNHIPRFSFVLWLAIFNKLPT